MDFGDGQKRYESSYMNAHHDHMVCTETGDVIEFHNEQIETLQREIAESEGYEVVGHSLVLYVKPLKSPKG